MHTFKSSKMYFNNACLVPAYHRQIYKPKCSGWQEGGGGTDGGRERREKERRYFSKYTTNLTAETPRLLENCWQKRCQVCQEQPPLPFALLTAWYMWKLRRFSCWSMKRHLHAKQVEQEEPGKMQSNPWTMWNPNSLDNSKIMLAQLYQASKRHTRNWLICILKTFPICFLVLTPRALSF